MKVWISPPSIARQLILTSTLVITIATSVLCFWHFTPREKLIIGGALTGSKVIGEQFPKTIIDPIGQDYSLAAPAKRIVSAILAGDEMLQQLNAQNHVISVTHLADDAIFSNVVGDYPKSIHRNHAEIEEILSMTPDLVIVAPYTNAITVRLLLANQIPVMRFPQYNSFEDIADNIALLAEVLDKKEQAQIVVKQMWQRIRLIECLVKSEPKPRVLYLTLNGATTGTGTLTDEMIRYAGGINVISETGITGMTRLTHEYAVSLRPDVLFLTDWFAKTKWEALRKLNEDPLWQDVPAVINKRIFIISAKISGTVTPHRVKGIEALAAELHPSLYSSQNKNCCALSGMKSSINKNTCNKNLNTKTTLLPNAMNQGETS